MCCIALSNKQEYALFKTLHFSIKSLEKTKHVIIIQSVEGEEVFCLNISNYTEKWQCFFVTHLRTKRNIMKMKRRQQGSATKKGAYLISRERDESCYVYPGCIKQVSQMLSIISCIISAPSNKSSSQTSERWFKIVKQRSTKQLNWIKRTVT